MPDNPSSTLDATLGVNIEDDDLLTVDEARFHPALRRAKDKPASRAKLYRLFDRGVRGVVLPSIRTPSGLRTSKQGIVAFIEALNNANPGARCTTTTTKRRAQHTVDAALDAEGIC